MSWYNKKPAPPESYLVPIRYRLRSPGKMFLLRPDGIKVRVGYGIGDTFEVMEPNVQFLIPCDELNEALKMPDGTIILEFDQNMQVEYASS